MKSSFIRTFQTVTSGAIPQNIEDYVKGKKRFIIIYVSWLVFLIMNYTIFVHFTSRVTVNHYLLMIVTAISLLYIFANYYTRWYVVFFKKRKPVEEKIMNEHFQLLGLNMTYSLQKRDFLKNISFWKFRFFKDVKKSLRFTQKSKITASLMGEIFIVHYLVVEENKQRGNTVDYFKGNLFEFDLNVPTEFQMSVIPHVQLSNFNMVKTAILTKNSPFTDEPYRLSNEWLSNFLITTNNVSLAEQILQTDIVRKIKLVEISDLVIALQETIEDRENVNCMCIVSMQIMNGKCYFFAQPKIYIAEDLYNEERNRPFKLFHTSSIDEERIWKEFEDILEGVEVIKSLKASIECSNY